MSQVLSKAKQIKALHTTIGTSLSFFQGEKEISPNGVYSHYAT